jgi:hypothetical protein
MSLNWCWILRLHSYIEPVSRSPNSNLVFSFVATDLSLESRPSLRHTTYYKHTTKAYIFQTLATSFECPFLKQTIKFKPSLNFKKKYPDYENLNLNLSRTWLPASVQTLIWIWTPIRSYFLWWSQMIWVFQSILVSNLFHALRHTGTKPAALSVHFSGGSNIIGLAIFIFLHKMTFCHFIF